MTDSGEDSRSFKAAQRDAQTKYFSADAFQTVERHNGIPYRFKYRRDNLAPHIRDLAEAYFKQPSASTSDGSITWHTHSNHALSSQACCLNFLMPLAHRQDLLSAMVSAILGESESIEVLEMPFETVDGRQSYIAFEWIGPDCLNETDDGRARTRGANATSADAALRFRLNGRLEMLLIEWKYTESYGGRPNLRATPKRRLRYEQIAFAPTGPILRHPRIDIEDLFWEPFYQLMRQQTLAHRIPSQPGFEDVARVRVAHISPRGNRALHRLTGPWRHKGLTEHDAFKLWPSLLTDPSAFVSVTWEDLFPPLLGREADSDWARYLIGRYALQPRTPT